MNAAAVEQLRARRDDDDGVQPRTSLRLPSRPVAPSGAAAALLLAGTVRPRGPDASAVACLCNGDYVGRDARRLATTTGDAVEQTL